MTGKTIWSLNFGTAFSLMSLVMFRLVSSIDLENSDKDIILIYIAIALMVFLLFLTYLFYTLMYHRGLKTRIPFYLASMVPLGLSGLFVFNGAFGEGRFTHYRVAFILLSGTNIMTYLWGLFYRDIERRGKP